VKILFWRNIVDYVFEGKCPQWKSQITFTSSIERNERNALASARLDSEHLKKICWYIVSKFDQWSEIVSPSSIFGSRKLLKRSSIDVVVLWSNLTFGVFHATCVDFASCTQDKTRSWSSRDTPTRIAACGASFHRVYFRFSASPVGGYFFSSSSPEITGQ
jgi:hypothetical protein